MGKHRNTSARLEKKVSKTCKDLLLALYPSLNSNVFSVESDNFESYHGKVWHDQHVVWFGPDYDGECDYEDCEWLLYSSLINNTTDFEGMIAAEAAVEWDSDAVVDYTPFYSPWHGASRAEFISHCRDLIKAGVTLERMR